MSSILTALFLGILQGLTEFLPVSTPPSRQCLTIYTGQGFVHHHRPDSFGHRPRGDRRPTIPGHRYTGHRDHW